MTEWKFTPERQKYHKIAQQAAWTVNRKMRSGQTPTQFANRPEYLRIQMRDLKRKQQSVQSAFRQNEIGEEERDHQLRQLKAREAQYQKRLSEMKAQAKAEKEAKAQKGAKRKRGTK